MGFGAKLKQALHGGGLVRHSDRGVQLHWLI